MGDDDNDADVPLPREGCTQAVTPTQSLPGSDTEEAQPSDEAEEEQDPEKEAEEAQPAEETEEQQNLNDDEVADSNMEVELDQLRAMVRRAEWSEELEQLQAIVDRFEFEESDHE